MWLKYRLLFSISYNMHNIIMIQWCLINCTIQTSQIITVGRRRGVRMLSPIFLRWAPWKLLLSVVFTNVFVHSCSGSVSRSSPARRRRWARSAWRRPSASPTRWSAWATRTTPPSRSGRRGSRRPGRTCSSSSRLAHRYPFTAKRSKSNCRRWSGTHYLWRCLVTCCVLYVTLPSSPVQMFR